MLRSAPQSLIDELSAALPGQVTQNETELNRHASDESFHKAIRPDAIVMARSTSDVQLVMRLCSAANVPVIPFGVGSSLEGQIIPVEGGITLDLSEMDKIVEICPDDLIVVVQPGLRRIPLNDRLAKRRFVLLCGSWSRCNFRWNGLHWSFRHYNRPIWFDA